MVQTYLCHSSLSKMMKLNPDRIEKKSFTKTDKKGREETWEWEEGPELRAFIEKQKKDVT